jgi:hypothetical protein
MGTGMSMGMGTERVVGHVTLVMRLSKSVSELAQVVLDHPAPWREEHTIAGGSSGGRDGDDPKPNQGQGQVARHVVHARQLLRTKQRQLKVVVLGCSNLPATTTSALDTAGVCDDQVLTTREVPPSTYVHYGLPGFDDIFTKCVPHNCNPQYNNVENYTVSSLYLEKRKLVFTVFNDDVHDENDDPNSAPSYVGAAELDLNPLAERRVLHVSGSFNLETKEGKRTEATISVQITLG